MQRFAVAHYRFSMNRFIGTTTLRWRWGCALFLLSLQACATHPAGEKSLLAFLDEPGINREEVYRRLGQPHATYEHDSIAAFRLSSGRDGLYVSHEASGWKDVRYDLLLEFAADERLTGHHLIDVRAQ